MPCSFCRSREHNIRYCNSSEVRNITSSLTRSANSHAAQFDYSGFLANVNRLTHNEVKIAALFWHTTIPSADYELLVLDGETVPVIECNYTKEKYVYIVLWLYLNYAFSNSGPENLSIGNTSMERIGLFIERLEYLKRIVVDGMSNMQSTNLYVENVIASGNSRIPVPVDLFQFPRRIDFDNYQYDSAAFGFGSGFARNNDFNNKFEFNIEEVGDSTDFAKIPVEDCPICYETLTESCVELGCTHITCSGCFILYLKSRKSAEICCSLCRADILTVKTYDKELIPDLECYSNSVIHKPAPEPHVPERFEDGDNIVINLV
jgi:hypothetical protein